MGVLCMGVSQALGGVCTSGPPHEQELGEGGTEVLWGLPGSGQAPCLHLSSTSARRRPGFTCSQPTRLQASLETALSLPLEAADVSPALVRRQPPGPVK